MSKAKQPSPAAPADQSILRQVEAGLQAEHGITIEQAYNRSKRHAMQQDKAERTDDLDLYGKHAHKTTIKCTKHGFDVMYNHNRNSPCGTGLLLTAYGVGMATSKIIYRGKGDAPRGW